MSHFFRRKASQVRGVRESVQPVLQPHHAHAQALRLQTLCLRTLRKALPAEGRPKEVSCTCIWKFWRGIQVYPTQLQAQRIAASPGRQLSRGPEGRPDCDHQ